MKRKSSKIIMLVLSLVLLIGCVLPLGGCDYCQHKLKELEKVPATCLATGLRTAYKCEKCGQMFKYSDATGLVEISKRETLPIAGHTVGEKYIGVPKSGGAASSLSDYEVHAECAVCEQYFKVNTENLIAFAPSDYAGGKHFDLDDGTVATRYTFAGGTHSGDKKTIEPLRDSKTNDNANVEVPFAANVNRYLVMFVHNESNIDVDIRYGAERNGERCLTDVHVPANGFASFLVTIKFSGGDPRSWHELYMMQDLAQDQAVTLSFSGYFYASSKVQAIIIEKYGKTEFAIGETLDVDKLVVVADYGENVKRTLKPDEYSVNLKDKVLTEEDKEVVVTFKKKSAKYSITVKRFFRKVTLVGATFANGSSTMEVEQGKPLPSGITMNRGKVFDHWIDIYGEQYTEYVVSDSDVTLKAVYKDDSTLEKINLALNKMCTVSEIDEREAPYFPVKNLTDGIKSNGTNNSWVSKSHSSATDPVWVEVDLGNVIAVNEVVLYPRNGDGVYFPIDYYIEISVDGEEYTKVFEMIGDTLSTQRDKRPRYCFFSSENAQYVRITATRMSAGGGGDYRTDYGEIEVYYA
ncbi:MAG: discoidin domain-containing protein [Clostridiales bacterium]|nr:discoidin domain-containing protein [Clostridiales bacterium]